MAISIVNGAECVFATKGENGIWSCLIENLYNEGKTTFRKPISCHLYPVRTKQFPTFKAVNYHKWHGTNETHSYLVCRSFAFV